jgi:hypothetical protein
MLLILLAFAPYLRHNQKILLNVVIAVFFSTNLDFLCKTVLLTKLEKLLLNVIRL